MVVSLCAMVGLRSRARSGGVACGRCSTYPVGGVCHKEIELAENRQAPLRMWEGISPGKILFFYAFCDFFVTKTHIRRIVKYRGVEKLAMPSAASLSASGDLLIEESNSVYCCFLYRKSLLTNGWFEALW